MPTETPRRRHQALDLGGGQVLTAADGSVGPADRNFPQNGGWGSLPGRSKRQDFGHRGASTFRKRVILWKVFYLEAKASAGRVPLLGG